MNFRGCAEFSLKRPSVNDGETFKKNFKSKLTFVLRMYAHEGQLTTSRFVFLLPIFLCKHGKLVKKEIMGAFYDTDCARFFPTWLLVSTTAWYTSLQHSYPNGSFEGLVMGDLTSCRALDETLWVEENSGGRWSVEYIKLSFLNEPALHRIKQRKLTTLHFYTLV